MTRPILASPKSVLSRRQSVSRLAGVAATLALSACGAQVVTTYRYKLSLEVETPTGIKRGFNVVDVTESWSPGGSLIPSIDGEALVIDIANGQVLVALLTKMMDADAKPSQPRKGWGESSPEGALYRAYDIKDDPVADTGTLIKRKATWRGVRPLPFNQLPDLVTFGDVRDPSSVALVDANNLAKTFGDGVSLVSATIEAVERGSWLMETFGFSKHSLTRGIEKKLPWLTKIKGGYLSGKFTSNTNQLVDRLHGGDFKRDHI